MKPTLQLRLGQSLTMTPQLQQVIRLLQLSTLELQQEIQQALKNNPLLEQEESEAQETNPKAPVDASQLDSCDAMAQEQMPDELPVDTTWDEVYSAGTVQSAGPIYDGEDSVYQGETTENLQDYLLWQMRLTPFSDVDAAIALAIIDAIYESGYLTVALEDIQQAVSSDDLEVELDAVEAVLKRVQHFDPVGIAARSVRECLLVQLDQYDSQTPWFKETKETKETKEVILEHMELLGNRNYRTLARKTRLKESDLKEVLDLIQLLAPRTGNGIIQSDSQYVIPDVSVVKKGSKWVVELNPDSAPRIRVNETYAAMARSSIDTQLTPC